MDVLAHGSFAVDCFTVDLYAEPIEISINVSSAWQLAGARRFCPGFNRWKESVVVWFLFDKILKIDGERE